MCSANASIIDNDDNFRQMSDRIRWLSDDIWKDIVGGVGNTSLYIVYTGGIKGPFEMEYRWLNPILGNPHQNARRSNIPTAQLRSYLMDPFVSCLYLQAQNGRWSPSRLSINVRTTALPWPMMRCTLWTASRSTVRRDRPRRDHRRWGQLNQTGGRYQPNLPSPEICSTAGQEDKNPPQPPKIYLKMSKAAKPRERPKAPLQKPAGAAQTPLHRLQEGLRRSREPAQKRSASTRTRPRRTPPQRSITTLSRWPSRPPSARVHCENGHKKVKPELDDLFLSLLLCFRLEQELRRLKGELQVSRQSEQELRSHICNLTNSERSLRPEVSLLRQSNMLLQSKWVNHHVPGW